MKRFCMKAILTFFCILVWTPLLMMAGNSLMSESEMLDRFAVIFGTGMTPVKETLIPTYPTLRPYIELLFDSPGFYVMFWNSCFQTGAVLAGQMVVALLAAWGFANYNFRGKGVLFFIYIVLMILPFQVTMVPNYLVLKNLKLLNSHFAVILPGIFSTFPVFIMTKFFEGIPVPLLEAAKLDGAGELTVFFKVGIPLGMPGIISAMVLGFLEYWNAIEQPMAFLKERRLWPLSLYLPEITSDKAGVAWAASIVMMILPVTLFILGQGNLEQGIAASGIKE